ncbi:MAG: hypothetical protein QOI73_193 [Solirubrobacteraceae bacterium]|nr:hypothetical protein [Solirubrobacteraceae bacterium]
MSLLLRRAVAAAATALVLLPAAASAAPPSNDDRASATALGSLPAQITGTTVEATRVTTDPYSACGNGGPQVWYRFTAPADERVAVRVLADGNLDAVVDAYLSERSQTRSVACDPTDASGIGALDFKASKDKTYLIAVSQLPNSVAGTFTLTVVAPQAPPRPPGPALPADGADGTLDRVGNVEDAYAVRMRAGHTYRLRLTGRGEDPCGVTGALYEPGTGDFDSDPVKRFGCDRDGYATYTPGPHEGGRYSVLVSVPSGVRTLKRYHLEAAGAGFDDTSPGRFLANRSTASNRLNGARIDAVDLYRFTVARRSDLALSLRTADDNAFDMLVLNDRGHRVACTCDDSGDIELTREIAAGRYFVAVRVRDRSAGTYKLRRVSRLLTRTSIGIDRRTALGAAARVAVHVRPAVRGPVTVTIQRFDPLAGWLFFRQQHLTAVDGRAGFGFGAPTVGRWRVSATFDGTTGAGSSASGFAQTLVVARDPT